MYHLTPEQIDNRLNRHPFADLKSQAEIDRETRAGAIVIAIMLGAITASSLALALVLWGIV